MRYLFIPRTNGQQIRIADTARGNLVEIADGKTVQTNRPVLTSRDGFTDYVAPKPAPPKPKPVAVPLWKFRAACRMAGIFDAITDAIATLPEPARTVVGEGWEYGNDIDPASATVQSLAAALKLTDEQVGDVFRAAAAIAV